MAAVVLAALDLVQRGVGEVEFLCAVVNSEAVRCPDVGPDDGQDVRARELSTHDAGRLFVPVGPEHQTEKQKKGSSVIDSRIHLKFTGRHKA